MKLEDLKKIQGTERKGDGAARGQGPHPGGDRHGHQRHRRRRPRDAESLPGRDRASAAWPTCIVTQAGERGLSSHEPIVTVIEEGQARVVYGNVSPEVARKIVAEHLVNGNPVSDYVIEIKK